LGDWWHKRAVFYENSQKLFSSLIELNNDCDNIMKVWIKAPYRLKTLWIFGGTEFEKNPVLYVISNKLKSKISITIDFENEKIEAISQVDVSDQLFEELSHQRQETLEEGFPLIDFASVSGEFFNILDEYDTSLKNVISLIRSRFHIVGISDDLIERDDTFFWSLDNLNFRPIHSIKPAYIQLGQVITQNDFQQIQNDLDSDTIPFFLAFKFLNSALNDEVPEFKILDATTAAELAIKEFLIRKNPSLEKLLSELQSPSLPKLYGPILEEYSSGNQKKGEKSPRRKILDYGNQLRNKIVHTPSNLEIPEGYAFFYCKNVESAICHLLTLLYPTDPLWKMRYKESFPYSSSDQKRLEKEFQEFVEKIQRKS